MILNKTVKINITNRNIKHFNDLGYKNIKSGNRIKIPPEHLSEGSHIKIIAKCDKCGEKNKLSYYSYLQNIKEYGFYTCKGKCSFLKKEMTSLERHGDKNFTNREKNSKTWENKSEEEKQEIEDKKIKTCLEKFGVKYSFQSPEIIEKGKQTKLKKYDDENYNNPEKAKETCLENYGTEYVSQVEEFKEKSRETNLKKRGVEYAPQSAEVKEKTKKTKLKKYNDENYNNPDKTKQTCLKKFGVEYSFQSDNNKNKSKQTSLLKYGTEYAFQSKEVQEKYKQTSIKNHGVEYPMQNTEVFDKNQKSGFKFKDYILPSGKIVKVQGYEHLALDILLKIYDENDLLINNKDIENHIDKIWYINDIGKKRRYFPDIYIISENKIIEVKSTYYYKKYISKNLLKEQACLDINMKFKFMVFTDKKQLLTEEEINNLHSSTLIPIK